MYLNARFGGILLPSIWTFPPDMLIRYSIYFPAFENRRHLFFLARFYVYLFKSFRNRDFWWRWFLVEVCESTGENPLGWLFLSTPRAIFVKYHLIRGQIVSVQISNGANWLDVTTKTRQVSSELNIWKDLHVCCKILRSLSVVFEYVFDLNEKFCWNFLITQFLTRVDIYLMHGSRFNLKIVNNTWRERVFFLLAYHSSDFHIKNMYNISSCLVGEWLILFRFCKLG